MRKVSWKAWASAALALALTAGVAALAASLWRQPPVPASLGTGPGGERRLVVGGPDVLVIEDERAFRVDAALHVTQLVWPQDLILDEVQSAAQKDGLVALTGKAHDHDPDKQFPVVLLADQAQVARVYKPGSDVKRAHVSNVRAVDADEDEPKETRFAVYVQEDNSIYRMPFYATGKDADEDRHPIEAGLRPSSVEKIVWREGEGPLFLCATEYRHLDEKQAPVMPTVAIDIYGHDHENPEVTPMPLVLGHEHAPGIRLGRLVTVQKMNFVPARLAANWLWLGKGEAFITDRGGYRLDQVSKLESFRVRTHGPGPISLVLAVLVALGALSLPIFIWRAATAGADGKALFGTLKIPGGGALETDPRGHVTIQAGVAVRAGGDDLELGPGLSRADARLEVPLIDGDDVFVFGRVEGDDGGPFRGSGRKRLVADGRRHHIGRGTAADYTEQMTARANGRVVMVALSVAVANLFLVLGILT